MTNVETAQRQNDELHFLLAAYPDPEEAWIDNEDDGLETLPRANRRLVARLNSDGAELMIGFVLRLSMPHSYPLEDTLRISGRVDEHTDVVLLKKAHNSLPELIAFCRGVAESFKGAEALLAVLNGAEDWINNLTSVDLGSDDLMNTTEDYSCFRKLDRTSTVVVRSSLVGRRIIYCHHIISTKKRSEMKRLSKELYLTGIVKVGWPGLILVEGTEDNCEIFYNSIRRWNWQHLQVRGEMQVGLDGEDISLHRRFTSFQETTDISVVAERCRKVGLEDLFNCWRTGRGPGGTARSHGGTNISDNSEAQLYGSLVHVDHMNQGKLYRNWLRRAAAQSGTGLLIKECFEKPEEIQSLPWIVVVIVGERESVHNMLKRWRTSRVDVDRRGKPCLERQMSLLFEGPLERRRIIERLDWESLNSEEGMRTSKRDLCTLLECIGGPRWVSVLPDPLWK